MTKPAVYCALIYPLAHWHEVDYTAPIKLQWQRRRPAEKWTKINKRPTGSKSIQVMMLLEEVGNRGSHFGGGMFYWRLPDPFCADPPGSLIPSLPQVNINVWPLCRWLLPLPHTSVDKNPLATQYVEGQGRKRRRRSRRRSSYSQEVLVNYYYILFFHGKDSEVGAATKSEVEGVNQSLAVICKSGLSTSSVWVCVYVCLTYFSMLTFELTIRKKNGKVIFSPSSSQ